MITFFVRSLQLFCTDNSNSASHCQTWCIKDSVCEQHRKVWRSWRFLRCIKCLCWRRSVLIVLVNGDRRQRLFFVLKKGKWVSQPILLTFSPSFFGTEQKCNFALLHRGTLSQRVTLQDRTSTSLHHRNRVCQSRDIAISTSSHQVTFSHRLFLIFPDFHAN